jgi:hypothetical protein
MECIGNFKDWINPQWIDYLSNNNGEKHPRIDPKEYGSGNPLDKLRGYGYKLEDTFWESYESRSFPYKLELPLGLSEHTDWWFVKMGCGNFIPFHKDHAPQNHLADMNVRRFWMPLQDYVEGHIFIIEHNFIKDYKAGDVFEYTNESDRHGAFNISMGIPRYTLNFQYYI